MQLQCSAVLYSMKIIISLVRLFSCANVYQIFCAYAYLYFVDVICRRTNKSLYTTSSVAHDYK